MKYTEIWRVRKEFQRFFKRNNVKFYLEKFNAFIIRDNNRKFVIIEVGVNYDIPSLRSIGENILLLTKNASLIRIN